MTNVRYQNIATRMGEGWECGWVGVGEGGTVSLFYLLCEMPLTGSPPPPRYLHPSGVSYQRIARTKS